MKYKSQIIFLILIALALILSACGGDETIQDAATFEGTVTVLAGYPVNAPEGYPGFFPTEWERAGWKVSETPVTAGQITANCTIYPNAEVSDQWFGKCSGKVYVPLHGAAIITVVVVDRRGNTIEAVEVAGGQR